MLDNHNDVIMPGAFSRTIRKQHSGKQIKLLWQHHTDEPIGSFSVIKEDKNGLYVEGNLALDVQRGNEAYSLLRSGALEGLSIGYTAKTFHFDEKTGYRYLTDVDLWEISVVTFPANPDAAITHEKESLPQEKTDALGAYGAKYHGLVTALDHAIAVLKNV